MTSSIMNLLKKFYFCTGHRRIFTGILSPLFLLVPLAKGQDLLAIPGNIAAKDRICFALYTVHDSTLKLTAQFYPLRDAEPFEASLEIRQEGQWREVDRARILYPGYTATFRVEEWDDRKEWVYRVAHHRTAYFEGIIRRNPRDKDEFVLAALTCNSIYPEHGGDLPKSDIVANLKRIQPDLLFFSGDQVYDHSRHLEYWLKFGRDFREIIRNTPTITIPDDHDVGQANLWGAGGRKCPSNNGIAGGYYRPASYVREVERAQTSHLPDPFDPTPIEQGIGVYYTGLTWGGISFAILEDRKFKSAPGDYAIIDGSPVDSIFDPAIDTRQFDHPEAQLLGERQLRFLEHWSTDWREAEMKAVLSQTIFAQGNNYSGKHERELLGDFDTNGWPQSGRNRALATIRKSFSCMIAGDQHLGTVIHHGVEDWKDAGVSFCTPAIANYWMRWWDPKEPGSNRQPGSPAYTGDFLDGFHNKITMLAAANPSDSEIALGGNLSTRAAGYGIIRFNKPNRTITFECWPRNVDASNPSSRQYPGWPITIHQEDNYPLRDAWQLPTLMINHPNQVVTVRKAATGELVSSVRVRTPSFQPRVPDPGSYSVTIGEGPSARLLPSLQAAPANPSAISIHP